MITVLLMYTCLAFNPDGSCASREAWKEGGWEGPGAPVACEIAKERAEARARALGANNKTYECESTSVEIRAEAISYRM